METNPTRSLTETPRPLDQDLIEAEARLIDLHSHTTASDGTLSPAELVDLARRTELAALAITDHDTFDGYEGAAPLAALAKLDLVRGLELNTRLELPNGKHRSVHLLAYWPSQQPSHKFHGWLNGERDERRERNRKLAEALQRRGIRISLAEVEERGRSLAGRTHFARLLVDKGYAATTEEAFDRYLVEGTPSYVERESPRTEETIGIVLQGNGIPVVAHPVRLNLDREDEQQALSKLKNSGLVGLEIYHSEHPPALQAHYRQISDLLTLIPTGGSDFHGAAKPNVRLGSGLNDNVRVPLGFLAQMRSFVK